jgi:hypothetical protein
MDRSYIVVATRQKLKNTKGASGFTLRIKNSFDYMRSGDENTVLGNEEAGSDGNKETILPLGDDGEDRVTDIGLLSVACPGGVTAPWCLSIEW